MARVFWVRHGENVANLTRSFSHRVLDEDLTDLGRGQALRLAVALASSDTVFTDLWCSPLRRAQQTADILASRLGLATRTCEDLREVNVGDLDGRSDAGAWQMYETVLGKWRNGNLGARFPRRRGRTPACRPHRRSAAARDVRRNGRPCSRGGSWCQHPGSSAVPDRHGRSWT